MKKELIAIYSLSFVNMMNFTVVIPILPFILRDYGGGAVLYGVYLSAYPFFQFFSAPLLGQLSDYYGRRPILLLSQAGTLLSWVIFAISLFVPNLSLGFTTLPLLLMIISRIFDGITGGNTAVANAYAVDIVKKEDRTKVFGTIGAVSGVAIILGPVLGGITIFNNFLYFTPVFITILISTFTLIFMFFFLPESLKVENKAKTLSIDIIKELQFLPKLKKYTIIRVAKYLILLRITYLFVFSSFTSVFVLYLIDNLKFSSKDLGFAFMAIGLSLALNQAFISSPIAKKVGDLNALLVGLFIVSIFQIAYALPLGFIMFFLVSFFSNIGISLATPTFKTILSKQVSEEKQGEIMGIDESLVSATSSVAPLIATTLYANIGNYVFLIQGVSLLVMLIIYYKRKGWQLKNSLS